MRHRQGEWKPSESSLPPQSTLATISSRIDANKLGTESISAFEHITISKCKTTRTDMDGITL